MNPIKKLYRKLLGSSDKEPEIEEPETEEPQSKEDELSDGEAPC